MSFDFITLTFLSFTALGIGFVKAGVPSLGMLATVILLLIFPAKDAIGLALLYLLAGDVAAIAMHHKNIEFDKLNRMLPSIILGILGAGLTLYFVSNDELNILIGYSILVLVIIGILRDRITPFAMRHIYWVRNILGVMAGFTTTVGNVAGPVISIYFLLLNLKKEKFVATTALFFIIVNVLKIPLYGALGIFKAYYIPSYLITVPLVFIGAFFGKKFLQYLPQKAFNVIVLVFAALAAIWLIIK